MKLLQRTALYQALLTLPMFLMGTAISNGLERQTITQVMAEVQDLID